MKLDCPHCHKSLAGRAVHWMQLGKETRERRCRHCGREIEYRIYAIEIATRLATLLILLGAGYAAKDRAGGYLTIVLVAALAIAAAYAFAHFWLRGAQRFRKGRNA